MRSLKWLKSLYLGGNPWLCECSTLNFKTFLMENKKTVSFMMNSFQYTNIFCFRYKTTIELFAMELTYTYQVLIFIARP